MGPDGSPPPLALFDNLRVGLVYDLAHFREGLPAPVAELFDLRVDECRGGFRRDRLFHLRQLRTYLSSARSEALAPGVLNKCLCRLKFHPVICARRRTAWAK